MGLLMKKNRLPKCLWWDAGKSILGWLKPDVRGTSSIMDWQETKWHCSFSDTVLALYFYTIYLLTFWIVNDKVSKCSAQCISFLNHIYAGTVNGVLYNQNSWEYHQYRNENGYFLHKNHNIVLKYMQILQYTTTKYNCCFNYHYILSCDIYLKN